MSTRKVYKRTQNFYCMLGHMNTLGDFIKEKRGERRWTLRQMAERTGVSYSLIGKIERGEIESPALPILEKLAKGLQVKFETLAAIARGVPIETVGQGIGEERMKQFAERFARLDDDQKRQLERFLRLLEEDEEK